MTISEIVSALSKELPYEWRVQATNKEKTKAMCSAFIDSRAVMKRLDEVCTHGWSTDMEQIGDAVLCSLTVYDEDRKAHTRTDVGRRVESNPQDRMYAEAWKGAASDAFKRAAVMFGIGRFLYDIPIVTLPCNDRKQVIDDRGQPVYNLTKYINDKMKRPPSPQQSETSDPIAKYGAVGPVGSFDAPAAEQKPEPAGPAPLKKITPKIFDAMVKAIGEGRAAEVRKKLNEEYDPNLSQRTALEAMLKKEGV